jgi:hypothetical protein
MYGTMAFTNGNNYPVKDVIMGCDFFDERGNWIGTFDSNRPPKMSVK